MPRPLLVLIAFLALLAGLWVLLGGSGEDPDAALPGALPHETGEAGSDLEGASGSGLRGTAEAEDPYRATRGGDAIPIPSLEAPDAWLEPHAADVEAGRVEAMVFYDKQPVDAGRLLVYLVGRDLPVLPMKPDLEGVQIAPIDSRGIVSFGNLADEGNRLYVLQVEVPGRPIVYLETQLWSLTQKRRFIRMGSANLHGEVRLVDGGDPTGTRVIVRRHPGAPSGALIEVHAVVDGRGQYEAAGLDEGFYDVRIARPGVHADDSEWAARKVWVGFKKRTRLDIGPSDSDPMLTGTLTGASGDPVRGPGELVLVPGKAGTARVRIPFDADGRFRGTAPEGSYTILAVPPGYRETSPVRVTPMLVTMPHAGPLDLTMAGAVVTGRVEAEILPGRNQVTWRYAKQQFPGAFRDVTIQDGRYRIEGVSPGEKIVVSFAGQRETIEIPADATRVDGPVFRTR